MFVFVCPVAGRATTHSHLLTESGSAQTSVQGGAGNSHGAAPGHRQEKQRSTKIPAPSKRKRYSTNSADREEFSQPEPPSQKAQIRMDSDTQNQVQVECRKTQTGDPDGIAPSRAGTRNYRIECFTHPGGAETGSSASARQYRHWIRCTTYKIRRTSGKSLELANDKGTRSHGQSRPSYGTTPTKRSSASEETKHEKSDERSIGEDPERNRLAEVSQAN